MTSHHTCPAATPPLPRHHHHHPSSPASPAYAIEATLLAIFLGDMLSSFFVARYERGVLVGNRAQLIAIYMRFRFWWDILTVLPWDW
jgi:hypothetical protein